MRKISQAEAIANTEGDWRKALEAQKSSRNRVSMDWVGLEATLRAYIRESGDRKLDDIVAEFTLRGWELPCPNCGEINNCSPACNEDQHHE